MSGTLSNIPEETEENRRKRFREAWLQVEVRTWDIQNTKQSSTHSTATYDRRTYIFMICAQDENSRNINREQIIMYEVLNWRMQSTGMLR
jgi:hypothetical protein